MKCKRSLAPVAGLPGGPRAETAPQASPSGLAFLVVINPFAGGGRAPRVFRKHCVPIFDAAGARLSIVHTEYAGHARSLAHDLDLAQYSGVCLVGGDGLVGEFITGMLARADNSEVPLAIIPGGTANALSHLLYKGHCNSSGCLAERAARACVDGAIRRIDATRVEMPGQEPRYSLSVLGWGLPSIVAQEAEELRWLPYHRHYRYNLAGMWSVFSRWPKASKAKLRYRLSDSEDSDEEDCRAQCGSPASHPAWKEVTVDLISFMAVNYPSMGKKRRIARGISVDDGFLAVTMVPKGSKWDALKAFAGMRKGKLLQDQHAVTSLKVREFELLPASRNQDAMLFNVDGDVLSGASLRATSLHKRLAVFASHDDLDDNSEDSPSPSGSRSSLNSSPECFSCHKCRENSDHSLVDWTAPGSFLDRPASSSQASSPMSARSYEQSLAAIPHRPARTATRVSDV